MNALPARPARVYMRTHAGRQAALRMRALLQDDERRLLLMLNGFTPLEALVSNRPELGRPGLLEQLLQRGLVQPVYEARPIAWE